MLNEEVAKYRELSGDTNSNTPISRIGGYLDGYEKALEQKPCEDAISRQAVLNCQYKVELEDGQRFMMIDPDDVENLPPISIEPKTGKWLLYNLNDICCSICGEMALGYPHWECDLKPSKYCPNCGAKMEVSE